MKVATSGSTDAAGSDDELVLEIAMIDARAIQQVQRAVLQSRCMDSLISTP